jgi:tRNA pseudouridine55 synthase
VSRGDSSAIPARLVLLDKPAGPTSFDMVRAARRGTRGRVGHAGTLDPFATGLLLIMTGAATRISSLLMGLPKEYDLLVQFGAVSSTGDATGEIRPCGSNALIGDDLVDGAGGRSSTGDAAREGPAAGERGRRVTAADIVPVLDRFRGRISQRVPLTSAVKVGGEPLYKKAHRGETADTPEREVTVYDLALIDFDERAQTGRLLALTSSGTYARVLAIDIGAALGCGGYAAALRRTRVGMFSVDDALSPEDLSPERYREAEQGVLTLDEALAFIPERELTAAEGGLARNGNQLRGLPVGRFRTYADSRLVAVYESDGDRARPLVVFPDLREAV